MADKEHEKMIKLGEWLEKYLNPNILGREYRELAQTAIYLYQIDFNLQNDLSLKTAIELTKASKRAQRIICSYKFNSLMDNLHNLDADDKNAMEEIGNIAYKISDRSNSKMGNFFGFAKAKPLIIDALKAVNTDNQSWSEIFSDAIDENESPSLLENTLVEIYQNSHYIYEAIFIEQGIAIKRNRFDWAADFDAASPQESETAFPWRIMASKILIDFLYSGGQDRILFCKQCGRFTVIRRRGRKDYCSPVCRSTHRNKIVAKVKQ